MKKLEEDKNRYNVLKEMPRFQKYMRKGQEAQNPFCRLLYCTSQHILDTKL